MVFSSLIFVWLFFPLVFVCNYVMRQEYSNVFLLCVSLAFYAWGEPDYVLLMVLMIFVNWIVGRQMDNNPKYKKIILLAGLVFDLGALGVFKYAGFGVRILNIFLGSEVFAPPQLRLPIGISFFTFQAVSYIADVYRGEANAQQKLVSVALYISFFPQLIAGPIVKYREISSQIEHREITGCGIAYGFRRFIYGLSKKVLISNVLGKSVDFVYAAEISLIDGKTAWIVSLLYTFQIYYDFSGYSDMAIGLGQMFGFDIPENFRYPYLSASVQEFWRRWHISLGSWFKEYVYIPLGGSRRGTWRTYVNLIAVFFLTGIWHGAGFGFIVWGMYYGCLVTAERMGIGRILKNRRMFSHIYLFLVVNFGWVIFHAQGLLHALMLLKRMLLPWLYIGRGISVWEYMDMRTIFVFICAAAGMGFLQQAFPQHVRSAWRFSGYECAYCTVLLILSIAALAGGTYNPFIYFQF